MTNLSKKTQVHEPAFLEEAGQYLEAHGYIRNSYVLHYQRVLNYSKNDIVVSITEDKISFMQYNLEEDDRRSGLSVFACFQGLSGMAIFDYMLLFHITKVATLNALIKGAMKQGVRFKPEDIFSQLGADEKPLSNHEKTLQYLLREHINPEKISWGKQVLDIVNEGKPKHFRHLVGQLSSQAQACPEEMTKILGTQIVEHLKIV